MRHVPSSPKSRRSRGSALITALLVILVLTVIGIGLAYFTQIEDRMSGNERLTKSSFYAAEAGLRAGEQALGVALDGQTAISSLLTAPTGTFPVPTTINPSGSGRWDGVLLRVSTSALSRTYAQVQIVVPAGVRDKAYYSVYIRNNDEDPSGSATDDQDQKLNLVAVGVAGLVDPGTGAVRGITKVLEEQVTIKLAGGEDYSGKQVNFGGTGSIGKGSRS